jgi:hypothetical protein
MTPILWRISEPIFFLSSVRMWKGKPLYIWSAFRTEGFYSDRFFAFKVNIKFLVFISRYLTGGIDGANIVSYRLIILPNITEF